MNFRDAAAFQVMINVTNEALVLQQRAILAKEPKKKREKKENILGETMVGSRQKTSIWTICHIDELRAEDTSSFFKFMRIGPAILDEVLQPISLGISKNDTIIRKALEPGLKLAVTLRYLASDDKYFLRAQLKHHHILT